MAETDITPQDVPVLTDWWAPDDHYGYGDAEPDDATDVFAWGA